MFNELRNAKALFVELTGRLVSFAILLMLLWTCCLRAAESNNVIKRASTDKVIILENYLKQGMAELKVPGLTIGIVEKGETVYLKSFGKISTEGNNVKNTTPFKLGSISKTFTSIAVMKLQELGKLNIKDPVVNYIPWFETKNKSNSDKITIKQLLNHTSGFSTVMGNRNQDSSNMEVSAVEVAVRELKNYQLNNVPGNVFEYSNANYQVLGLLIQKVSGKSYSRFIKDNIFVPLKMNNSFLQAEKQYLDIAAKGHIYLYGRPEMQEDLLGSVTSAQGGIYSSSEDMMNYLKMMLSDEPSVLSFESKLNMLTLDTIGESYGYALGWYFDKFESFTLNYHFGQSRGFEALVAFSPELELGWFVAVNSSSAFGEVAIAPFIGQVGPILNGKPAHLYGVNTVEKVLFWFLLFVPALALFLCWRTTVKRKNDNEYFDFKRWNKTNFLTRGFLPVILSCTIPWFLLTFLPESYGAPLSAVKFFQPTIYYLAFTGSIFTIAWILIRTIFIFRFFKRV